MTLRHALTSLCLCVLLCAGCAKVEPARGTRVTFGFTSGKAPSREKIADLSRYLILRSEGVLDIRGARVEKLTDTSFVFLLPGKQVSKAEVAELLRGAGLEFYHLSSIATARHPGRSWRLRPPTRSGGPYLFDGPNARRIDSRRDPRDLMRLVVGYPVTKPILTGADVLPNATMRQTRNGWGVVVKFDKRGAAAFRHFTAANRGEYLAVFYNGFLISAALVGEPIAGGEALLTGFASENEAKSAASGLNAGVLPVEVRVRSVSTLGAGSRAH